MHLEDNIIGIVGGMGPEAGLTLFKYILQLSKAKKDQEHLSVILMSFPKHIVDRTRFLEGGTDINPAIAIAEVIGKLESSGAKVIGISCNTSHSPAIYDTLLNELNIRRCNVKMVHMPGETCRYIKNKYPYIKRIGVMSTNGTFNSGVYRSNLEAVGFSLVVPDFDFQNNVIHRMIYDESFGIKSNSKISTEVIQLAYQALSFFKENEAQAIILGCTELSMAFNEIKDSTLPIIDSSEVLALALIREALSFNAPQVITDTSVMI